MAHAYPKLSTSGDGRVVGLVPGPSHTSAPKALLSMPTTTPESLIPVATVLKGDESEPGAARSVKEYDCAQAEGSMHAHARAAHPQPKTLIMRGCVM